MANESYFKFDGVDKMGVQIIKREMGKVKSHIQKYCVKDNWENRLKLR